jgi:MFS transporter, DHA2 family, multidrug resistance protein
VIAGYNAQQAGTVMLISGVPAFLMIPFLPRMIGRLNVKFMVGTGLLCVAVSCFIDAHLTAQVSGGNFVMSQIIRGFGQILATLPLNQAALAAVRREDTGDAAGIFNMARNLGGSIGLALIGLLIDRRGQLHVNMIGETVTANSAQVRDRIAGMASSLGNGDAAFGQARAISALSREILRQAIVMTYAECFWLLSVATLIILPLILLLRQPTGFMSVKRT